MIKFVDKFSKFITLLKNNGNPLIPERQIEELEYSPTFNPILYPMPQEWWKKCFDWYVAIPIIPNVRYGPFYRCDKKEFWPQIGIPTVIDSEKACFYGLEDPIDQAEAKRLYSPRQETIPEYSHTIIINSPACDGYLFLGPVQGGDGFQMNPNSCTANIIRSMIINKQIIEPRKLKPF